MKNDILSKSDVEIIEIAHQLRVGYEMKRTMRYRTVKDITVHSESVAEHVFGLIYLAQYFVQAEELGQSLDVLKLHQILLFHDFGEIKYGDVPFHQKSQAHEDREKEAAKEIFASLPENIGVEGHEHWEDYEKQKSAEAHFAYALDKIEPMFELLDPINERSIKRLNTTFAVHVEKKLRATKNYPVMQRFMEALSSDMLRRDLFVEEE